MPCGAGVRHLRQESGAENLLQRHVGDAMSAGFRRRFVEMFVTVTSLKYALLVS